MQEEDQQNYLYPRKQVQTEESVKTNKHMENNLNLLPRQKTLKMIISIISEEINLWGIKQAKQYRKI